MPEEKVRPLSPVIRVSTEWQRKNLEDQYENVKGLVKKLNRPMLRPLKRVCPGNSPEWFEWMKKHSVWVKSKNGDLIAETQCRYMRPKAYSNLNQHAKMTSEDDAKLKEITSGLTLYSKEDVKDLHSQRSEQTKRGLNKKKRRGSYKEKGRSKQLVIEMYQRGFKTSKIAKEIGVTMQTVRNWVKEYLEVKGYEDAAA